MSRSRLTAEKRREQILDSAVTVFGRKGFEGATTRALARRAGVSEAMIFRFFPDKAALAFLGMVCNYALMNNLYGQSLPGRMPCEPAAKLCTALFLGGVRPAPRPDARSEPAATRAAAVRGAHSRSRVIL